VGGGNSAERWLRVGWVLAKAPLLAKNARNWGIRPRAILSLMKKYKYSIVYFDRTTGTMDYYMKMPMDGVESGTVVPEFLRQAGEHGWELCCGWNS